jgi:hypothetical protein
VSAAKRATVLVLAAVTALAACGASSDDRLSSPARARLEGMTREVRVAAASRNRLRTRRALAAVRREVLRDRRTGDIGATRAKHVLADVAAVEAKLVLLPAPTTTTTTTTTTSPPGDEPGPGPGKHGHGKGDKHGNGNQD